MLDFNYYFGNVVFDGLLRSFFLLRSSSSLCVVPISFTRLTHQIIHRIHRGQSLSPPSLTSHLSHLSQFMFRLSFVEELLNFIPNDKTFDSTHVSPLNTIHNKKDSAALHCIQRDKGKHVWLSVHESIDFLLEED